MAFSSRNECTFKLEWNTIGIIFNWFSSAIELLQYAGRCYVDRCGFQDITQAAQVRISVSNFIAVSRSTFLIITLSFFIEPNGCR